MSISWKTAQALRPFLEPGGSVLIPPRSKAAATWLRELGLGHETSQGRRLDEAQAAEASKAALAAVGVSSWAAFSMEKPQTRAQSLAVSSQEKRFGARPASGRVQLRPAPGRPLLRDGQSVRWDADDSLEIGESSDPRRFAGHDGLVVIENLESFRWPPNFWAPEWRPVDLPRNPLLLWRGGGESSGVGASRHFSRAWSEKTDLPVLAFFDLDPSGLAMAMDWPGALDIIAPTDEALEPLFKASGRPDLYAQQKESAALGKFAGGPEQWSRVRALVERWGRGLPQEHFCDS